MSTTPAIQASPPVWQDHVGLSQWVIRLLYAQIFVNAASVASGYFELRMLHDFSIGRYISRDEVLALAHINDLRQAYLALASSLVSLLTALLILRWIYRSFLNAASLQVKAMRFSATSAVLWFFVPLVNLWKPFQAMKELWTLAKDCGGAASENGSGYLPLWWALWILAGVLATWSMRLQFHSATLDDLQLAGVAGISSDVVSIPLSMVFMVVVRELDQMLARCHNARQ